MVFLKYFFLISALRVRFASPLCESALQVRFASPLCESALRVRFASPLCESVLLVRFASPLCESVLRFRFASPLCESALRVRFMKDKTEIILFLDGIKPEDGEILVTGASGGVGTISVALLSELGYKVVAVTGKDDPVTTEMLTKLGASSIIKRSDFEGEPKALARETYVGCVDTIGGTVLVNVLSMVSNKTEKASRLKKLFSAENSKTDILNRIYGTFFFEKKLKNSKNQFIP
jgi:hypothetical protein